MESSGFVEMQLWKRALLWLLFLAPFFFTSYGFATWYTSQLDFVTSYYFEWETHIPVIAWTIIPYWSIDIFYGISLFICTNKQELDSHAKRLLSAQIIAVICFLLFPLTFSFDRPEVFGMAGVMFNTLYSFDKPFNQAPSLHIALLIILWLVYLRHLPKIMHWFCHAIAISILVSVLTTYQHHFIDIPTGFLLGVFCIWMWPYKNNSPLKRIKLTKDKRHKRIAAYYTMGAVLSGSLALIIEGTAIWFFWPAWSMFMVASFYLFFGSIGFQKNPQGKISFAVRWMLYPYLIAARINALIWTRNSKAANPILDQVFLGRFPSKSELNKNHYSTVIDLTAEFNAPQVDINWHSIPCLDLVSPNAQDLLRAAQLIEQSVHKGAVLVCCALGYSRSTLSVIVWLVMSKRSNSVDEAISLIKAVRAEIIIKKTDYKKIELALQLIKN